MAIPFGPWRPDPYLIGSNFCQEALNVLPSSMGKKPFPDIAAISNAVGADVRGAYVARSSSGSAAIFAFTATKAFKFDGTSAWTDVSNAGGNFSLPADDYWSIDQQDNILYAAQAGDPVQWINVDSGTNFAALGGSPPQARYVKAVGDFLFLLDLTSPQGPVASTGRIQGAWSGIRDFDHWTYGEKSSDFFTRFSGGHIMGMTSRETGLLIQEGAVNRFQRVGDRRVWNITRVEGAQGTRSPHSIVEHQGVAYYYGTDGFVASAPGAFTKEAGIEWVDEWFKETVNVSRIKTVIGALDPTRPRIFWLFPTVGNDAYALDHIIGYDKQVGEWFHAETEATFIFKASTTGTTLENLGGAGLGYTLETVPYSLDSDIWKGGAPRLGAFTGDQRLGYFTGSNLKATIRTPLLQLIPGKRAFVRGFRPTTDAENVKGRVATAERPQDSVTWGSETTLTTQGLIPTRASARLHRFENTIAAGENWDDIQGIDLYPEDVSPDGAR